MTLKVGASATEDELRRHVRGRPARFKAPKTVVFGDLPKTSTEKIQEFVLPDRDRLARTDQSPDATHGKARPIEPQR
ncbi:hypothetical protein [Pseudonocardia sp. GCM10023141]|uniref:hypothetical protein n=1 Tax=Pseudonocardia sp. GCM10023141 TaxID=3252653 RepID=UPI003608D8F8